MSAGLGSATKSAGPGAEAGVGPVAGLQGRSGPHEGASQRHLQPGGGREEAGTRPTVRP